MNKTAIITCTSGDFEYIDEWIDYHHKLGVDLFLIGYNGPSNRLKEYKLYDYVRYIDFSYNNTNINVFNIQKFCGWNDENVFLQNRMQKIENILLYYLKVFYLDIKYCLVIDTDEFVDIKNKDYNNIGRFLKDNMLEEYSSTTIVMNFYTDNNLIYKDDRPCIERFTKKSITPFFMNPDGYFDLGCRKTIINMLHPNIKNIVMLSPHTCSKMKDDLYLNESEIAIKHFWSKTLEEYIEKMNPDVDSDYFKRFRGHIFWDYFHGVAHNEITEDKLKAIPELLKKYNINYNIYEEEVESEFKLRYILFYNKDK